MASSHSSPPVPHPSSSDGKFKKEMELSLKTFKAVRLLPDVCPKEPTGNSSSLGDSPSVVADQHRWTVYHSKVNLPAALNDPRLSKRESDFFTKTWGLDFMETEVMPSFYLPPITKEHFASYLHNTTSRQKLHEKCKETCPLKDGLERTLAPTARSHDKSRTDLDQVPKIFLKSDFALEDPATFSTVLPWSHFSGQYEAGVKGARDGASSRLLQEKLSHYLDVVEVNIAQQISLRSDAFFHAMTSQHELQDYLTKTSHAVKLLRDKIAQIDKVMCEGSLQILRRAVTRNNCVKIYNKLKLMATVHQTQPTVQLLLSTSEFVGALDLIATTQEVLQQELQGIHSFRHLGSQLCELERLIDKMMIADFSTYAHSDLNRPLEDDQMLEEERLVSLVFGLLRQRKLDFLDIYHEEMIIAAKNIIKQIVIETIAQMEEIDTDIVLKLADQMRMLNFPQWLHLLTNIFASFVHFLKRVKTTMVTIRGVVFLVLDKSRDKGRELETIPCKKGSAVGHNLDTDVAYLTHEGMFISDAYNEKEAASSEVEAERTALANSDPCGSDSASEVECATDSSSSKEHTSSTIAGGLEIMMSDELRLTELELGRVANNIQELLYSASDMCHDRCVKFLMARAKLNSSEFVALSRTVEVFVQKTEVICTRRSMSLRGALQSQANKFVNRFHEERKTKLGLLLDNERWKQAEVPTEFQDLVNSIEDGVIALPEKKATGPPQERKPAEFLAVDGEKYAVVGTVLLLIRIIFEYCQCVDDIPSITTDMLTRLADLLKHFNSRSCQLVLGAGALQVVGLKTITTKNLALASRCLQLWACRVVSGACVNLALPCVLPTALASRCLQLIVYYIPIIRAHFEARLQPKQYNMLRHFEHITKDYNDHIAEILAKLVAIMDGLCDKTLSKYEVKAPVPSTCFRNICKQISKMHEAIYDLLPAEQTQMLFLRINSSFKVHLKRQLMRLNVVNDGGPLHGLVASDLAFYTGNIQALKGLESLDINMAEIWEQRR
ncbi:vacuolar protein sorting-associated protein 54 isoform X2 [Rhinoraja longicauda]